MRRDGKGWGKGKSEREMGKGRNKGGVGERWQGEGRVERDSEEGKWWTM